MRISILMEKIANGDKGAFEQLYHMAYDKVKAVAINILKIPSLADDVVQETFIKVWKNSAKFRPNHDDERWIIVIARNTALTLYNKLKHDREFYEKLAFARENYTIEEQIDDSSDIMQLLDKEEREVIKMKIAGYSQKEMMNKLNCNRDRINYLYKTTRIKLEQYIKTYEKMT